MFSKHKGNKGEAYLLFLGMEADEDFNPNQLSQEHFNEINLDPDQLVFLARMATDFTGANVISKHPNATPKVVAILGMLLLEQVTTVSSIEL